jgi:tetratricopeptide (TPR) repeat protein
LAEEVSLEEEEEMRLGTYAWFLLAVSFGHAESIQNLTAQIQKKPSAALYVDRGTAYLDAGDAKQAVADFDRALEQDAVSVDALRLRAVAQSKLGRSANAITDLSSAIALAPADATLYWARAEAYAAAGDARHAGEDREEAVRLDPAIAQNSTQPLPGLAVPPAESHIASTRVTVAANLAPNSRHEPDPVVAIEPSSAPKAAPVATPAPSAPEDESADALYQRGRDLVNKGKPAEGIVALTEAIHQQPNNATYYNSRGFGYYLTKDFKKAIQDFDEAVHLKPNYLNAVHNRALAKKNAGDADGYTKDHELELQLSKKK